MKELKTYPEHFTALRKKRILKAISKINDNMPLVTSPEFSYNTIRDFESLGFFIENMPINGQNMYTLIQNCQKITRNTLEFYLRWNQEIASLPNANVLFPLINDLLQLIGPLSDELTALSKKIQIKEKMITTFNNSKSQN